MARSTRTVSASTNAPASTASARAASRVVWDASSYAVCRASVTATAHNRKNACCAASVTATTGRERCARHASTAERAVSMETPARERTAVTVTLAFSDSIASIAAAARSIGEPTIAITS
ncbi:hypothetical protein J2T21_000908 [Paeniglutamicibacter psychrophenolicus]|nr:hypothetical protein [Paeniglutamicibacter psychrophenolicus]